MPPIMITKRNGAKVPLDIDRFHKVVSFACEGISGVSASEIEIRSQISFGNGMNTADIQNTLIKTTADLIDADNPNYQHVAGRLVNYHIRKEVYGQYEPKPLYDTVKKNVKKGFYTPELLEWYTEEDFETLDKIVDHDRDDNIVFAGMEQWRGKYLVKNRTTGQILETPQVALILISAVLFHDHENRFKIIKEYYDAISKFYITLPTPFIAGVRTREKQFSSCVLIDIDDSLDSLTAGSEAIVKYVSRRAGIGINLGRVRSEGSDVKGGLVSHTGKIPFIKYLMTSTKSCSQGGLRGGSATLNFTGWDLEFENLVVLKNDKGTEDTRARHLDYCVQLNRVFYERLISDGNITLFSPSEVPGLYEAFFRNVDEFRTLYEKYENNSKIRKKTMRAVDWFSLLMGERKDTGRIYIMNVDNVNQHSAYDPDQQLVYMTNLCTEILNATKPLKDSREIWQADEGRISLCTLTAINWGICKLEDMPKYCNLAVVGLNAILKYQNYPMEAAKAGIEDYAAIGVGVTNLAYWLVKNDLDYDNISDEGLELLDEWAEAWSYNIIKASSDVAAKQGACRAFKKTIYGQGLVPFDTRAKGIDELVKPTLRQDWKELKERIKVTGVANSPMMAQAPTETSSLPSNSTNGSAPPRALVAVKQSKDGVLKQVVPELRKYKARWEKNLLWNQKSCKGYLKICAVLQKWMDGGMSVDTFYNEMDYPEGVPMSVMIEDLVDGYRWGQKTNYYCITNDGAGEVEDKEKPELAKAEIEQEPECENCAL